MITTLSVSVHQENEDPIFGKYSNIISLLSEGGGMFIELEQDSETAGKARFDFSEFDEIVEAVKMLRNQSAVK